MRRWFYPNKVHADRANLTKWYLSIWRSNLEIEHIVMTIRTSISFLWNEWINTCNATLNVRYMNGHSSHIPWLNYGEKSSVYTATTKKVMESVTDREICANEKSSTRSSPIKDWSWHQNRSIDSTICTYFEIDL